VLRRHQAAEHGGRRPLVVMGAGVLGAVPCHAA
jgi:hypothetical protein